MPLGDLSKATGIERYLMLARYQDVGRATDQLKKYGRVLADDINPKVIEHAQAELRKAQAVSHSSDKVKSGAITLENFGEVTSNATRKVMVWQFAIMGVYGVMNKFSETIDIWRELEVTLTRIGITTDATSEKLYQFFRQASDIAIEYGMPIEKTIKGMDLAMRATAEYSDTAERAAVSTQLLRDASMLSNIANMEYAQSIDTLVGSLRQSGMQLNEGQQLLDKWVLVAKNAAVSVNDLSQGFAIMADAAKAAGLNVDQVNGLIAALSESVTLGPVQVGNAIRAIMSTLYNPGSIQIMRKFGVSVRDVNGEIRSFWDVMSELSAMRVSGALDESAWLEIAKAAGAGQRRYAQFLAILNNWDAAMRVANISARANGEALDANQRIVETLTNSFDKLTAAWNQALYALGDRAGYIEDLTGSLNSLARFFQQLADAPDWIYDVVKALTTLGVTLAGLKIGQAAVGWLHLKNAMTVGSLLGMGMLGRVPGTQQILAPQGARYAKTLGEWRIQPRDARGRFQPAYTVGSGMWGVPYHPWSAENKYSGRAMLGRFRAWSTRPLGLGPETRVPRGLGARMGAGLRTPGSLFAIAGAYAIGQGLTGERLTGVGSAVGTAIGAAFGPAGMVAGAAIGGLIGHVAVDTMTSEEERISRMFERMSTEFGLNISRIMEESTERQAETFADTLREIEEASARHPVMDLWEETPLLPRLFGVGSNMGRLRLGRMAALGDEWESGTAALPFIRQAVSAGVIRPEEMENILARGTTTRPDIIGSQYYAQYGMTGSRAADIDQEVVDWRELTDAQKLYVDVLAKLTYAYGDKREELERLRDALEGYIAEQRDLLQIENEFGDRQARVTEIYNEQRKTLDGLSLKQWEQAELQELVANAAKMTTEEFENLNELVGGLGISYASLTDSLIQFNKVAGGIDPEAISLDEWMDIRQYAPERGGKITDALTSWMDAQREWKSFLKSEAPSIQEITGLDPTNLENMQRILDELERLERESEEPSRFRGMREAYGGAADAFQQIPLLEALIRSMVPQLGQYVPRGDIRLASGEDFQRQLEGMVRTQEGTYAPAQRFTDLAESLDEYAKSIITIVDPITGQIKTIEGNTLAIEMARQATEANTEATKELDKRLEYEYNIPSWYEAPGKMWYYKTTGDRTFGPTHETAWELWEKALEADFGNISDASRGATDGLEDVDQAARKAARSIEKLETSTIANPPARETPADVYWRSSSLPEDIAHPAGEAGMAAREAMSTVSDEIRKSAATSGGGISFINDLIRRMSEWDFLPSLQTGGTVTATGPYYLHKDESVIPSQGIDTTNNLLGNSQRILATSQGYLQQISLGIAGLRQEMAALRQSLSRSSEGGETFEKVARAGHFTGPAFGVGRR